MINQSPPSLFRSIATGAIGFCLVSFCVFATVAFAERSIYRSLGLIGAYIAWTVLFILLGGTVFGMLVVGRWRLPKFYLLFGLAFFAYAAGWMLAYFSLGGVEGEFVGSLAGSVLMAVVFAVGFGSLNSTVKVSAVLLVTNFLGYFLGQLLYGALVNTIVRGPQIGMLLWGISFGLFFGGGIGAALQLVQRQQQTKADTE